MDLGIILRANLDLFWSREVSTVRRIRDGLKELVRRARLSGRRVTLEYITPWNLGEGVEMGLNIAILEESIKLGRMVMHTYSLTHEGICVQWSPMSMGI